MKDRIENEIKDLNNQILELKGRIKLKEEELNALKLEEDSNHIVKFMIKNMTKAQKITSIEMLEKLYNFKFDVRKKFLQIIDAKYVNIKTDDCFWLFEVNDHGLKVGFNGAFSNEEVKGILTNMMKVVKEIHTEKYLGVCGTYGTHIPEIENGDYEIILVG